MTIDYMVYLFNALTCTIISILINWRISYTHMYVFEGVLALLNLKKLFKLSRGMIIIYRKSNNNKCSCGLWVGKIKSNI